MATTIQTIDGVAVTAETVIILLGAVEMAREHLLNQHLADGKLDEHAQKAYDELQMALDAVLK